MISEGRVRPIEILLIEDNPADVRLTVEGLKEAKVANKLHAIMDGRKALDFLFHRGEYVEAPRPDVILLDLNLPGVDGRTILKQIKEDPILRVIPVVVITSSEAEADIIKSYEFPRQLLHFQTDRFRGVPEDRALHRGLLVRGCEAAAGGSLTALVRP